MQEELIAPFVIFELSSPATSVFELLYIAAATFLFAVPHLYRR